MPYIDRRYRWLYGAMLACLVLFGVTLTVIGATLPKIIHGFGGKIDKLHIELGK